MTAPADPTKSEGVKRLDRWRDNVGTRSHVLPAMR